MKTSLLLLTCARLANDGLELPEAHRYAHQIIPYISLFWPETWVGQMDEVRETRVLRFLFASELAKGEGD